MQYLKHQFPITIDGNKYYWDALPDDKYNAIMNYDFMIYICEGNESEKLEWFRVVNIAGEKLTEQELRNSVYEDVQKPKGIYEFLLCKDDDPFAGRLLNLRAFDKRDKLAAYSKQNGICPICKQHFEYEEMEGDHIKPWSKGGHTTPENCQMLCKDCNRKKTDKY